MDFNGRCEIAAAHISIRMAWQWSARYWISVGVSFYVFFTLRPYHCLTLESVVPAKWKPNSASLLYWYFELSAHRFQLQTSIENCSTLSDATTEACPEKLITSASSNSTMCVICCCQFATLLPSRVRLLRAHLLLLSFYYRSCLISPIKKKKHISLPPPRLQQNNNYS